MTQQLPLNFQSASFLTLLPLSVLQAGQGRCVAYQGQGLWQAAAWSLMQQYLQQGSLVRDKTGPVPSL